MQTDFALRTLLYLAHVDKQVSVDDVATGYNISRDHLFKVVQQLVRLGYVQSRAGRNGGIRLVKPPASIRIGEVVGEFEGRNGVLPCVADPGACRLEPGCSLRSLIIKAEQAFYDTLNQLTIADVIAFNAPVSRGGVFNLGLMGLTVGGLPQVDLPTAAPHPAG